ncbi:hypothetical protein ACLIYP_05540 [Streptomyces nanhaiensis]|uniref:hypothetical protein n=1 Tax=Streptomyces nanhaiensis TaxID=679319 RepID=UPI00399CEE29
MRFTDLDSYLGIVAWWKEQNTGTLAAEEMFEYRHPIMLINTLEGTMSASPGDYVIRGVQGEIYPCKPDIFEATYEPA